MELGTATEPPCRVLPCTGSRFLLGSPAHRCSADSQGQGQHCSQGTVESDAATAAAISPGPTDGYEEQSLLLAGASSCSILHCSKTALELLRAPVGCGMDMTLQSQPRKCLLVQEESQDGVWVLADPRDMELSLPGGTCGNGPWQGEGSKVIAVMNTHPLLRAGNAVLTLCLLL